ncbi:MAG: hypothetical protein IIX56_04510 [Treponema sp.]|nr:hypothetical protein [Treponema sp.]MBQ2234712.1 hypothetical protein [Treponema sp.]
MKVLILSVADKRHMSMVAPYEDYLISNNIYYDIIRVNRYDTKDITKQKMKNGVIFEYPFYQSTSVHKLRKIFRFINFRNFAKKLIYKNNYDFIIVWNENTAVLFADVLLHSYKNKYCVNVRDAFEIKMLNGLFEKVINNAYFSTTPSPVKEKNEPYITLFNRDTRILEHVEKKKSLKSRNDVLRITFMGLYNAAPKTFQTIVEIFANDNRFELHFYGDEFETKLQEYVDSRGITNVITGGSFPYEKTYEYLSNTDILNSYYNNFSINQNLRNVSGVKQSYTPMLYLPAINDDNTTWAKICKTYGFSYLVNDENLSSLPNDLYNWYHDLNFEVFKKGCDEFNKLVEDSRKQIFELLGKIK